MARGSCPKFRVGYEGVGLVVGFLVAGRTVIPDAVQHDNVALLIRDPKHAVSLDQVPCLQSTAMRCTAHGMTMR